MKVTFEPNTFDVRLYVEFPLRADPKKDLKVVVRYDDIINSISGQVSPMLQSLPLGVIKYDIIPVAVKIKEDTK